MTQEEKARAYDEALEDMRVIYPNLRGDAKLAVEHAFPELAESENEKTRKEILNYVLYKADGVSEEDEHRWVTWLEKQKYDRMQPVYDNQESFESALDKAWKSYNDSGARAVDGCEDNYTECAHAKGFREGYLFGLEKQKEQKLVEKQDYSGLNDLERAIHRGFLCAGVENVPVTIIKETAKECLAQMKSAEWSEKDEYRIRQIERIAQQAGCTQKLQEEIHDWLKSLRPSWRPSEQEKGALRTAIYVLTEERNFPKAAKQLQAILDAFDGKGSRKDWKPSDEQLRPLEYAIDYFKKKQNDTTYLESLYNDLKKLM